MTLSPVWDETFFISPQMAAPVGESGPSAVAEAGDGVRFEIWDHDLHGDGDYLGALVHSWGRTCVCVEYDLCHDREAAEVSSLEVRVIGCAVRAYALNVLHVCVCVVREVWTPPTLYALFAGGYPLVV